MEHISGAELKTISGQRQGTNGGLSPGLPDHLAVGLAESSTGGVIGDLLAKFIFISCSVAGTGSRITGGHRGCGGRVVGKAEWRWEDTKDKCLFQYFPQIYFFHILAVSFEPII